MRTGRFGVVETRTDVVVGVCKRVGQTCGGVLGAYGCGGAFVRKALIWVVAACSASIGVAGGDFGCVIS